MIRRLLIFTGGVTVLLAGVCYLSHTRQFGYVGSWKSIGLRDGKLWYIWRATPIPDGEGFYVDDVSAVNRAMYHISMGARWRDVRAWPWLLGILAAVGYALILPPIRRLWKRPAPRWLVASLIAAFVLLTTLWTTSHLATVTFDRSDVHLRLSEGTAWAFVDRARTFTSLPWGTGLNVRRDSRLHVLELGGYFAWRRGAIMLNVPLGILILVLVVPTMVLARPDRRALIDHCKRCAYDLTGNLSGVCPECGTLVQIEPQ